MMSVTMVLAAAGVGLGPGPGLPSGPSSPLIPVSGMGIVDATPASGTMESGTRVVPSPGSVALVAAAGLLMARRARSGRIPGSPAKPAMVSGDGA